MGAAAVVAVVVERVAECFLDVGAFGVGFAGVLGVEGDFCDEVGAGVGEFVA